MKQNKYTKIREKKETCVIWTAVIMMMIKVAVVAVVVVVQSDMTRIRP
jgi:hypothetical protein